MTCVFHPIQLRFFASALSFVLCYHICAQQILIKGTVKDSASQPLFGATVACINKDGLVINYTFSKAKGQFEVLASASCNWMDVSCVGYKQVRIRYDTNQKYYNIWLSPEHKLLKEVVVRKRPEALLSGDTLRYLTNNFATREDRSIGDVLSRLPGVDIAQDGTLYFNGKKIKNLYIDGDDLMDGRYGMAVKVIRKELILGVEIINHHQPINVLRDKVFTDDVAVNLVLKNENSLRWSAAAQAGAGIPGQLEASFAPLVLSRKVKSVNLFAFNSAGIDYKNELKKLGSPVVTEDIGQEQTAVELSLGNTTSVDVPMSYYYLNNSSIVHLNTLLKTRNNIQFKINSSFFYDRNNFSYESRAENYLPLDTIYYAARQKTVNRPLFFTTGLNVFINKDKYFLDNSLQIQIGRESFNGTMQFNNSHFMQQLIKRQHEFSNEFVWMPSLKNKNIAEVKWTANYGGKKQELLIDSGYYFDVIPQQGYFDAVKQITASPAWISNAGVAYKIPSRKIYQEYRIGHYWFRQLLKSGLSITDNAQTVQYNNDYGNDLVLQNSSLYLLAVCQLKLKKIRSEVRLPLVKQAQKLSQPAYSVDERKSQFLFLPRFGFTYNFDNEKYIQASYRFQNQTGGVSSIFRGAVLMDYHSLQSYNSGLQQEEEHQAAIAYYYQKSIKLLYLNAGLTFSRTTSTAVTADSFSNNIRTTFLVPVPGKRSAIGISSGVSKYLFTIKAKMSAKVQAQRSLNTQIVNMETYHFRALNLSATAAANKKIARRLDFNYECGFFWSVVSFSNKNKNASYPGTKYFSFDQRFKVSQNFLKNYYIEFLGSHRVNDFPAESRGHFFFLDADIKRTALLKGADIELSCLNFFDVKNYTVFMQQNNQLFTGKYPLRGRSLFLRLYYSF